MNEKWEVLTADVNLDAMASVIREEGLPVHVRKLALAAVRIYLAEQTGERVYAAGNSYISGEKILLYGKKAVIEAVEDGQNPAQGRFKILILRLPDGSQKYMAAEVLEAPKVEQEPSSDRQVDIFYKENGLAIRTGLQNALQGDERFVWFQDAQGDQWCLVEMLPIVSDDHMSRALSFVQRRNDDLVPEPVSTEELVHKLWELDNDGSIAYILTAFALNAKLQQFQEVRWVGGGWLSEQVWKELQNRPKLVGPREPNVITIPSDVVIDKKDVEKEGDEEKALEETKSNDQDVILADDMEKWQRNRLVNASLRLGARHYYCGWLPLSQVMRRVFPPMASKSYKVTFHHRFGGYEDSFRGWVDWSQERITVPEMYEVLREQAIYPGAELVVSHRGTLWDYDIRTKPLEKARYIRVRQVELETDEDGNLIVNANGEYKVMYSTFDQRCNYKISDEVFVAAAPWEYRIALFEAADRIARGYFQLVWETCCEWWETGERKPLYITDAQLYDEIHNHRRLVTSDATIPWLLWRYQAFEAMGNGRFLFRPEKGELVRSFGITRRASPIRKKPAASDIRKNRTLKQTKRTVVVWDQIINLVGQRLATLGKGAEFEILSVSENALHIRIDSTGREGAIYRRELESMWSILTQEGELTQSAMRSEYSQFKSTYLCAIIAKMPEVSYETKPIRLFYRRAPEAVGTQTNKNASDPYVENTGFFIFQQRTDPEYADKVGDIYNWRQGIPGSKQIEEGARFIYYRPGERVFFGTGQVTSIFAYVGEDGITYYDGNITDYESWDPLALTTGLASRLSFVEPNRLGIGQAGIRRISRDDFNAILDYRREMAEGIQRHDGILGSRPWFWNQVTQLTGRQLHTLDRRKPFDVVSVSDRVLKIRLAGGTLSSLLRRKLEGAWAYLVSEGEMSRSDIEKYLSFNSSYTSAILAAMPDVTNETRPIRLKYQPPSSEDPTPSGSTQEPTRSDQLVDADLVFPSLLFEESSQLPLPPSLEQVLETQKSVHDLDEGLDDDKAESQIDTEFRQIQEIVRVPLVGQTIYKLREDPNHIIEVNDETVTVFSHTKNAIRWQWMRGIYRALSYLSIVIFKRFSQIAHIEFHKKPRKTQIYHKPEDPIFLHEEKAEEVSIVDTDRSQDHTSDTTGRPLL